MILALLSIFSLSAIAFAAPSNRTRCSSGNSPTTRQCWTDGFDIDTDYYTKWPNTGVIREYWFSVENHTASPAGTEVNGVLSINGSVPGPTLYGDWGDTFVIHVTNNLQVNGTSIHWHGMRQWMSNAADGVPGVTQCPQPPNSTRTYRFVATQYGSSWYHSHYTVQYAAGLYGGIQINGPSPMNYDIDLGILTLGEWFNTPTPFAALIGVADAHNFPVATGILMNGTNDLPCDANKSVCSPSSVFETTVTQGTFYKLRLVNVGVQNWFRFTIDNHRFWVVSNDFVPVRPFYTDSVVLGMGQRSDIIFQANQAIGNYWMRAMYQPGCLFPMTYPNHTMGILRYQGASEESKPTTTNYLLNDTLAGECGAPAYFDTFQPWLLVDPGPPSLFQEIDISLSPAEGPTTFLINNTNFLVNWEFPTVMALMQEQSTPYYSNETAPLYTNKTLIGEGYNLPDIYNGSFQSAENIISLSRPRISKDQWAYFYINNHMAFDDWHPMHIHGHDFFILSQGGGLWYPENGTVNTYNPPQRDVSNLPAYGHLVFAIRMDNPGMWLMHCHIAWHVSEGLAWQFMEQKEDVLALYDQNKTKQDCNEWHKYVKSPKRVWGQDDSGV